MYIRISSLSSLFTVPCPVRNLTISVESNATLVVVEWEDSACPNGNVTYVVLVTCTDEATLEMILADVFSRLFGQDLRIEIPDPGPYVNCMAAVIASNSAGNSSESREQVVTPQGGKPRTHSHLSSQFV